MPLAHIGAFFATEGLKSFLVASLGEEEDDDIETLLEQYISQQKLTANTPDIWFHDANNFMYNKVDAWFIGSSLVEFNQSKSIKRMCIDVRNTLIEFGMIQGDQSPNTVELVTDILNVK